MKREPPAVNVKRDLIDLCAPSYSAQTDANAAIETKKGLIYLKIGFKI